MRHAIVEKLDRLIHNGIHNEPEVVYLLVEVRKLLELEQRGHDFRALLFHCDWVVHARLSGAAAQNYLSLINRMQRDNVTRELHADAAQEVALLIGAERFRQELQAVLTSEGICPLICDPESEWSHFMSLYGEVISDVPLTVSRTRQTHRGPRPLDVPTYIDAVTVRKHDHEGEGGGFDLEWNLHFIMEPERYKMPGWRMQFQPDA